MTDTPPDEAGQAAQDDLPTVPYESTEDPRHLPAHLERIASRDYCAVNEGFWILRDAATELARLRQKLGEAERWKQTAGERFQELGDWFDSAGVSFDVDWQAFIANARAHFTLAQSQRDEAVSENTRLRAALATSKDPCVYCQLPADEMAQCRAGFPGCARMDDITGCPEFGAMMQLDAVQSQRDALAKALSAVNVLIAEAAMTGFNCHDGDWAQRLYDSQQETSRAIASARALAVGE